MEIERKEGFEGWLLDRIKVWLKAQPRTDGIHVSDLLYPLKAYWKRIDPRDITDDEAGYFVAGQGHHFVIESILHGTESVKDGKSDGGTFEWEGIHYSPDFESKHPLEIKTNRSKFGPKSYTNRTLLSTYKTYLAQLLAYMAIRDTTEGDLVVFYLAMQRGEKDKRTRPEFRWYRVTAEPAELEATRGKLLERKRDLEHAIETKDPKNLPLCEEWLCRSCPWADQCHGSARKEEQAE